MTITTDPRRELRTLYSATEAPALVTVPPIAYLAVDGHGDPQSTEYTEAVIAAYTLAYAARTELKRAGEPLHRVMPLETAWVVAAGAAEGERTWSWTTLIAQPATVTEELVAAARAAIGGSSRPRLLDRVTLRTLDEGCAAQLLHVGPYGAVGPDIARLHAFIKAQGLAPRGRHHEIYLNDPRRTAPRRLRIILRQPVGPPAVGPVQPGP